VGLVAISMTAFAQGSQACSPTPVLVYSDGAHHVFTAALNGTGAKLVLSKADEPVVSPDGKPRSGASGSACSPGAAHASRSPSSAPSLPNRQSRKTPSIPRA
jgi:hypothetical protein